MPERKDSVDSFDEFFGETKTDDNRKKSPIRRKQSDVSIPPVAKNQAPTERSRTPTTPIERRHSSSKPAQKLNNTTIPSQTSNRTESAQSKAYESDFDNDNDFEDDETIIESTNQRNKTHGSLPPNKKHTQEAPRRGSDSEVKASFTTKNYSKPTNGNARPKETILPFIRTQQSRRTGGVYPARRRRDSHSSVAKNDMEQRATSARHNKMKSLESRLAELRRELENQRIENATLRTIQRREEKAIKKYEEKEYDIHRIVRDFTYEIDHMKETLTNERDTKVKLEKQIEVRDEKLREQTKRLKKFEKIVQEKNLDERHELREKLNETDKKLQEIQEKLTTQEKYIEHLEKNHRHEVQQELIKQRELKRQIEGQTQKYNDLLIKFEDKTRQVDTMHIYVQRGGKRSSVSPTNLTKSRSLQSLNETSPRAKDKVNGYDKKRREPQERDKKSKSKQRSISNDSSPKQEKKSVLPKKTPQSMMESDEKSTNGHLPPKSKPPVRRLSTPKSIEEEENDMDNEDIFGSRPKKLPPPKTNQRNSDQHQSHAQIHKRPPAPVPSSVFKLTEPPMSSKSGATRPLDEKWSNMFETNDKEDPAKEDLLAKLVADEQQERRLAAATTTTTTTTTTTQSSSKPRAAMNMFETSTRKTTEPSVDPFESLFSNNPNKPAKTRTNDSDDIFSAKPPPGKPTTQNKTDLIESLFG